MLGWYRSHLEQMGGKGMPECITGSPLCQSRPWDRIWHGLLNQRFVHVMPTRFGGLTVLSAILFKKEPLPAPVLRGVALPALRGARHVHPLPTVRQVPFVHRLNPF